MLHANTDEYKSQWLFMLSDITGKMQTFVGAFKVWYFGLVLLCNCCRIGVAVQQYLKNT